MKKIIMLGVLCMALLTSVATATPGPVVGDKTLLDASSEQGMVINLDEFFAAHPLEAGKATRGDVVFKSPRIEVALVTNRGPLIDLHYHATCEETVLVYKGSGEMYVDGKWVPIKAGEVHVNPRGVVHASRVTGDEDMKVVCFFSAPQTDGNDKVFVNNPRAFEGKTVGAPTLLDTKERQGLLLNLEQYFAAHPLASGVATRSDSIFKSPRIEVLLGQNHGPLIGRHYHSSAEEIVYVHAGTGEMYVDGEWLPVKGGDLHINPRGAYHATRVTGNEDMKVLGIFAAPQANGNDKVFLDK